MLLLNLTKLSLPCETVTSVPWTLVPKRLSCQPNLTAWLLVSISEWTTHWTWVLLLCSVLLWRCFLSAPKELLVGFRMGNCKVRAIKCLKKLGHSQMLPRGQSCVCDPLFRFGDLSIDTLCTRQKLSSESLTLVHPLTISCLSYSSVARGRLWWCQCSHPVVPWAIFLKKKKKRQKVWCLVLPCQCHEVRWKPELIIFKLKTENKLTGYPRAIVPKDANKGFPLLFSFYFSYFTLGDSGNLPRTVAGQKSPKRMSRRVAGWCVCVSARVRVLLLHLWHLSFSLHSICWPANCVTSLSCLLCHLR